MSVHSDIELGISRSTGWRGRILVAQRTAKRRRNLIGNIGLTVVGATVLVWQLGSQISAQRREERSVGLAAGCEITPDGRPIGEAITRCPPASLHSGGTTLDPGDTGWLALADRPAYGPGNWLPCTVGRAFLILEQDDGRWSAR